MRIDVLQGQQGAVNLQGELLSRLTAGEVIRAQILDFVANEVFLRLMDGSSIKASVETDILMDKGQFANFVVKENSNNKVLLEQINQPKESSDSEKARYIKDLKALGVQINDDNINIIKELKLNNISISKDLFNQVKASMTANEHIIDIPKAIILAANSLPASEKNINTLNVISKGSAQLTKELSEIIKLLEGTQKVTSQSSNKDMLTNNIAAKAEVSSQLKIENSLSSEVQNIQTAMTSQEELEGQVKDLKSFNNDKVIAKNEGIAVNNNDNEAENFLKELKILGRASQVEDNKNLVKDSNSHLAIPEKDSTTNIKNQVEKLFVSVNELKNKSEEEIKNFVKDIMTKLDEVSENISKIDIPNKEMLLNKLDSMNNNLRFINELSNHTCYVQIPIKLNGAESQADIYVLKRHRNKKINPEDATLLLALETSNLGRVESLVIVNKKNISMNMRLEKEEFVDFLKDKFINIYKVLSNKGYKLVDIKYRTIEEPLNILNAHKIANEFLTDVQGKLDIRL